ncbi:MAG: beta-propeller fold lactonase family protein [Deltaproteobacteria bacterium]|nr:beta-propeller fold lactonase family protein [Deltaproteobacteria bacterium]MCL5792381.1 beta-propeller fold lactonase family protein [Deltaproteobacteria bacterium]
MKQECLHVGSVPVMTGNRSDKCRSGATLRPILETGKLLSSFLPIIMVIAALILFSTTISYAFPNTKIGSISVGNGPYGIAGNGTYVVVAESQTGYVDLINFSNNQIAQKVLLGTNPSMVTITHDGTTAYVTNYGNNSVYAINLNSSTGFTTSTISVGSGPIGICIANNTVFVTNYANDTFSYFPVGSSSPTTVQTWGGGPISIAANSSANAVYVANSTSNAVNVFQYNFNASGTYGVTTTITTGSYPSAILLTPDQTKLYVANANDNTISVINTSSNSVVNTISLGSSSGGHPNGLAITPDGSTLMVINSPTGGITYIQTSTNTVINTLSLGSYLKQAYVTSNGSDMYVTDYSASTVYELSSVVTISSTKPSAINNTTNNTSVITWSSTMSGTYEAEIGGNGTKGSGIPLPGGSGSVTAGQTMTMPIYASDLINLAGGKNGPYTIYIYVTTTQGIVAYASTSILLLTVPPSPASNLSALPNNGKAYLNWTASTSQYLGGYYVYYSTSMFDINSLPSTVVDAGNTTSYTLNGLTNGTLYYIGAIAYDLAANKSTLSNITTVTPVYIPSPSDLSGQKGNCFIATAAYGSYDQFDVWVLRQFRNKILLTNKPGIWFVKTYYKLSPPIAHFIAGRDTLRAVVRVMLQPFVLGSMVVLYGTMVQKIFIALAILLLLGTIFIIIRYETYYNSYHSRENGNP